MMRATLLAVDDRKDNLFVLSRVLEQYLPECTVIPARSAEEAMALARANRVDGVLVDVQMPGTGGVSLCRQLKADPATMHAPVVLITSHQTTSAFRAEGLAAGADDFIARPIDNIELIARLRVMLRIKRAEDGLRALNARLETVVAEQTEALREEIRLKHLLLDAMPCVAFLARRDHTIIAFNRAAAATGLQIGQTCYSAWRRRADPCTKCVVSELSGGGAAHSETFDLDDIQWEAHWIAANEDVVLCYAFDVTERLRLEGQLRESQKMEAIGRVAGGVAHDFNNLLTAITGFSVLLLEQVQDERLRPHLEEIRRAADRAALLTRQLLAFSRRQMLQPQVLDLNKTVIEIEQMLRRLVPENITIALALDERADHVRADPGQMQQVVVNLVVNAGEAMPRGGLVCLETASVEIGAEEAATLQLKPGPYASLSVTDNGDGIDADALPHVFEPFFSTKRSGTGLGLSTVYGIVKQSEGHISVASERGRSTTFRILLPRGQETTAVAAREPHDTPRQTSGSETILLVEDASFVRSLARLVLSNQGYRVIEAEDGPQAIQLCQKLGVPIDLVVTDVVMPEMSGHELVGHLQRLIPDARVLYCSGYFDDMVTRHGVLSSGANFLPKPYTPSTLVSKVREVLDRRDAPTADARAEAPGAARQD
jgi:signal transduction histidine kinase